MSVLLRVRSRLISWLKREQKSVPYTGDGQVCARIATTREMTDTMGTAAHRLEETICQLGGEFPI